MNCAKNLPQARILIRDESKYIVWSCVLYPFQDTLKIWHCDLTRNIFQLLSTWFKKKKEQVDALQDYSVKDSMLSRFFQQLKIFTVVSLYIGEVFLHTVTIQQTSWTKYNTFFIFCFTTSTLNSFHKKTSYKGALFYNYLFQNT